MSCEGLLLIPQPVELGAAQAPELIAMHEEGEGPDVRLRDLPHGERHLCGGERAHRHLPSGRPAVE